MKKTNLFLFFFILIVGYFAYPINLNADIKLDGSLGTSGSLQGPDYRVEAAFGHQAGQNLFHSFEKFNIANGERATFAGPADISRVISRVTGGEVSNIDGILSSEIQGADFYFINPYGMVFGKNARLDISGSFYATSADYIRLGENGRFDAKNPSASVLTSAPPEAFGFLGSNPGNITVKSSIDVEGGKYPGLFVEGDKSLTIAGGDIDFIGGAARTYLGPINLVSIKSIGELDLASMNTGVFSKLGNITAKDFSVIFSYGGGSISVKAQNLSLVDGGEIYTQISSDFLSEGIQEAGDLDVDVRESILISGNSAEGFLSFLGARTIDAGTSRSGDINIYCHSLSIDKEANITSYSYRSGESGYILIDAETIEILGGAKISSEIEEGFGRSGDIIINAGNSFKISGMDDYGRFSRIGTTATNSFDSTGGDINVTTPLLLMDSGYLTSSSSSAGDSGNISVYSEIVELVNGASIFSSIYEGIGKAGDINIKASDRILMTGSDLYRTFTNINSAALESFDSYGGNIEISAGDVKLEDGAFITSSSLRSGNSGNIFMDVTKLQLINGGRVFADIREGQGRGGDLIILAKESIDIVGSYQGTYFSRIASEAENSGVSDGGTIRMVSDEISISGDGHISTASNSGNGGRIDIDARNLNLLDSGSIISSKISGLGKGGDISIWASEDINISGRDEYGSSSGITSSANQAPGAGSGNIDLHAANLIVADGGYVTSSAFYSGDSGTLFVDVNRLDLLSGGKILSAIQGGEGRGGDLYLKVADSINISGKDENGPSSIITSAVESFSSRGGDLYIIAGDMTIDGGFLTSSGVESGDAGNLYMQLRNLSVINGGYIASSVLSANGMGGDIYIDASGNVFVTGVSSDGSAYSNINSSGIDSPFSNAGDIYLRNPSLNLGNGGFLSSSSLRSGDAGNIYIWSDDVHLFDGGHIDTSSDASAGGSMFIEAGHMIRLEDSYITSSVYGGTGDGGNMSISDPKFVILDASNIIAKAFEGNGGNIDLKTGLFLADPLSRIDASSQLGIDGIINIDSPDVDVNASLVNLPDRFEDVSTLLSDPCLGRRLGKISSLVVLGRGGIPDDPYSFRQSKVFEDDYFLKR